MTGVAVPEAAVNEYDLAASSKHKVRFTWQRYTVEAISIALCMQQAAQ